jgi:Tol biopolymer transport system component
VGWTRVQLSGFAVGVTATLTALGCVLPSASGAAFPGRNGRIAFSEEENLLMIRTLLPTGRQPVTLIDEDARFGAGAEGPAFSPRGRWLAFNDATRIWVKRANGRGRPRALTRPASSAGDLNPDWSPGGRSIVFERGHSDAPDEIRILRRRTGSSRRLTTGADPAWSVRHQIAFVREEDLGVFAIYVVEANGSGWHRVVAGSSPDWSSDGRRIVFLTPHAHVATIGSSGRGFHQVTRSSHPDGGPSFSPQGRRIVFVRKFEALYVKRPGQRRPRRIWATRRRGNQIQDTDWQPLPPRSRRR